ncbi:hypothetical protein [Pseudooctadecabacter jejudonensis]|uniref:Lipoprotein n=1 Tax=Pseudooctadecabacter jejudonensis TaxID=1391910 RepID=A0A1Y5T121_9RHOB|nr:hypothetical protein [Pseudooctadecabacter jejudonensis]SLN53465.1 hypothetical protein PSJ8397_02781 [Pseudooctadecabacter jejudonensis]
MKRRTFILTAPLALAACGDTVLREEVLASQADIDRVAYTHPGPKSLTLFTMKNVSSGNGAHSGLMINASQRVLWDPAGTFGHPSIPERNDVHYGVTPRIEQFYTSYHSRATYYTLIQEVEVPPEVAEMALRMAIANGPTPKAACTRHTSRLLGQLPGFTSIRSSLFPNKLADQFGEIPGVRSREYYEDDSDDKSIAAAEIDAAIRADQ